MNTRTTLALGACLSLAAFGASAQVKVEGEVEASGDGYVAAGGNVIKTGLDECLQSGTFSADSAINKCEGIEEAAEEVAEAVEEAVEAKTAVAEAPAAVEEAPVAQGKVDTRQFSEQALFDTDSAELNSSGIMVTEKLFSALEEYKGITDLTITGHTDSRGSDEYNMVLSERRAQTVANVISARYPDVAMTVQGMGETAPVASNDTAEGRQLNRRVEIDITATRMVFN